MHQIREVLRLTSGLGLTQRQTARSMHISRGTVSDIVQRAHGAGLDWPLPLDLVGAWGVRDRQMPDRSG